MNWFYASQGQRAGPVDDDGFARLVADGTVNDATLVWHAGMPDWMPYAQARATVPPAPGTAGPLAFAGAQSAPVAAVVPGAYQAQCSQCGRVFPGDEVIRLEGFNVCAECKPALLQKMRQGLSPAVGAWGALPARFGGFWIRFGALFLDGLILSPLTIGLVIARVYLVPNAGFYSNDKNLFAAIFFQVLQYAIGAAYQIFFVGRYGGTPGKMICGLQIVRGDGSRVTYGRATGRYFAQFLSSFTLGIGYLIAAFDSEKRALHDHVCDTRVVYKS